MAKKPSSSTSAPKSVHPPTLIGNKPIDISKLITKAEDVRGAPIYSNHIQITSSSSELIVDFFRIEPDPLEPSTKLTASYLQRIFIPLAKAKSFALAISQSISNLEEAMREMEIKEPPDSTNITE